jgi:hypothetical protein
MIVELQAQAKPIKADLIPLSTIDNYEMLELFGMIIKFDNGQCKLSDNIVVLRDEEAPVYTDKTKIFPLSDVFSAKYFTEEELKKALNEKAEELKYLRVFLSYFKPQDNGKITQKQEQWFKFKAWRYDIDDINYTLEQVLELIDKLPLKPNIVKKSNKGWHLIYVFDRFLEREEIKAYEENKKDSCYIPYMAYEILTKLLTNYLKELEPKLDVKASNKVSMIATRFISEKLPAYLFGSEYSLEAFVNAFLFLVKREFAYENLKADNKNSTYTVQDISKEEFYNALSRCGVIKALEEDWENHRYNDWFVMFNIYAVKCLYAENQEELEEIKQEFHEKSSRYPNYKYEEAEYMLNDAIKRQREGLKLHGCKGINKDVSSKYLEACKSCPYKKVDKDGNIYGHYLFTHLYRDNLEDDNITVKGWVLKEKGWCMYNDKNGSYIQVLPYFTIRAYYLVGEAEDEYIEIVDKTGRSYIKKVERKKDNYLPSVDLVKSFGEINPFKIKDGRMFLAQYIEKVKRKRGIKLDFVGYRYRGNAWDIVVGGNGKYSRKEILFMFQQKSTDESDWYVPEVKGNEEYFKAIYRALFGLDDAPLHLAIAHYLSWVGREFIKDRSIVGSINPILVFVGDTGTGKSIRVKIAQALYGNPNVFSFSNNSQASFNNRFPLIKTPFAIDEVIMKTANDERKFGELIYNITNLQGKTTFNNTYDPITVPVIMTGETENLLIDKAFSNFRGLNRRSVVIEMTDRWKHNSPILDDALSELDKHHGHILGYVKSLKEEDKKEIIDWAKGIDARLQFGDSNFTDLRKHLALSLAMFCHFYEKYIKIDAVDVAEKVNNVIDFTIEQVNKNQAGKIGENVDYVEEVINFIAKIEEAMNNKKSLKSRSYKQVCNAIHYTPSNRVGELLKKFFWKKYDGSGVLRFVLSSLIVNPFSEALGSEKDFIIETDKSRLESLTDEELKIWAKVLEARYNKNLADNIAVKLENKRLLEVLKVEERKENKKEKDTVDF